MEESSGISSSGRLMIGVKVDRFWNRHWRLLLFISVVLMSCITGAMWMSSQRARARRLIAPEWKVHYSRDKQTGAKVVFHAPNKTHSDRQPGIDVEEKEEAFEDYVNEEKDPQPNDVEYYYDDKHDPSLKSRVDDHYSENYETETRKAMANKDAQQPPRRSYMPQLRDYTLQREFRDPFRNMPQSDIEFEENYNNPCWPESIPRWPYQNNSYLLIDEQQKLIDPVFQGMRRRFAGRTRPQTRWRLRCLPAFYVMETPPLATPSLFTALGYHPKIAVPQVPEPEYWNKHGPSHMAPLRDYVDLFDAAAQRMLDNSTRVRLQTGRYEWRHTLITGDGTSSYLWAFDPWQKVAGNKDEQTPKQTPADFIYKMTPLAKLVFVLRNPTDRLFQGYLSRTKAPSKADFHDKVGEALEKMTMCEKRRSVRSCVYDGPFNRALPVRVRIGMYYPFLSDWLRVFPRDQVMVIRYEDYIAKPSETINEVCKFLGVTPFPVKDLELLEQRVQATERKRKATQIKMLSTTKAMLKTFHRIFNEKLAALLQDDQFTWPELATAEIEGGADAQQTTSQEDLDRRKKQAEAIEELRRKQLERQEERKAEYAAKVREWRLQQLERRRTQMDQPRTEMYQQQQDKDIPQPRTEPNQQQRDSDVSRQSVAPQDDFRQRQLRRLTTLEPGKPPSPEQGEKTSTVQQAKKLIWSAEGRSNASDAYDRSKLFYDIGRKRWTQSPERSDQHQGRTSVSAGEGQKPSLNEGRTNAQEGSESRTGRGQSTPEPGMSQRQPSRVNEDRRDRSAADDEKLRKPKWQSVNSSGGSFSDNRMKTMDQRQRADTRAQ